MTITRKTARLEDTTRLTAELNKSFHLLMSKRSSHGMFSSVLANFTVLKKPAPSPHSLVAEQKNTECVSLFGLPIHDIIFIFSIKPANSKDLTLGRTKEGVGGWMPSRR